MPMISFPPAQAHGIFAVSDNPTTAARRGTVVVLTGDVREQLKRLPDESVHCVITSPPYFNLRDYGTATWIGGDPTCDHVESQRKHRRAPEQREAIEAGTANATQTEYAAGSTNIQARKVCAKCGAVRQDKQIGLESTLEEYINALVVTCREVRRVLRSDGTFWLNLGDSYCASGATPGVTARDDRQVRKHRGPKPQTPNTGSGLAGGTTDGTKLGVTPVMQPGPQIGLKHKDKMLVPHRVALALVDDGWYIRQDIVWTKPTALPESVTDRPTCAHEFIFLLAKTDTYFFDQEPVREPIKPGNSGVSAAAMGYEGGVLKEARRQSTTRQYTQVKGANVRSVWEIATEGYPGAHFATFPPALPRRCIMAGTSERGCCPACGAPWVRVVDADKANRGYVAKATKAGQGTNGKSDTLGRHDARTKSGEDWQQSCDCPAAEPVPCVVMDIFGGSGTTGMVAAELGRNAVLVELNPRYVEGQIKKRLDKSDVRVLDFEELVPATSKGRRQPRKG